MQNKSSNDKRQEKPSKHVTKERNIFHRSNSKNSHDNNWQAKSRETKLVRSGQFVVVLERLVWPCWPMRKWQSLLHMAQMKLEEGKMELFFCGKRASLQLSGDVSSLLSQYLLSLSAFGGHDHTQHLSSCLDKFRMLCGNVSKRP